MKSFKVAEARARFGVLLDEAEQGTPIVIERRGVRFTLAAQQPASRSGPRPPVFEFVNETVLSGEWTWNESKAGLRFQPRRIRRR